MHFKKLEIVGFKSFLNKTKLKFEPGVTAIVGPNGCGKSNIVDAIKWVLGEQSVKSMRSAAMQDVIFNGTDKHDPVSFAEVSLTLSNEDGMLPVDYDEVTVSRRLYRSGESEYLLNKTQVRLADIRGLMMGTGIGTSSYSIVEQGKMDMILSSRPEERRYVFEEASGITKFKTKKREALLKLERTKDNLIRINDITLEVERQIRSIERKARKAERYKVRFDELRELHLKKSTKDYREISTDDSSLADEGTSLHEIAERLAEELKLSSERLMDSRGELNSLREKVQGLQNEVVRISSDIDMNNHTVRTSAERKQELQKTVERLDWEIEEQTERREGLYARVKDLEARYSEVKERRIKKDEEFKAAEENARTISEKIEKHRHELKMSKDMTVDAVSEQTKTRNLFIKVNADIQNTQARIKRLKLEKNSVQLDKDNVSEELKEVESAFGVVSEELETKTREHADFCREFEGKQAEMNAFKAAREEKEKRLNEIKPRRMFIERLISEREGINDSVKEIMKRAEAGDPRFNGVHGILSELISICEGYDEAMRSVLGDTAQALVVEGVSTAESITTFLRDNSMESVNFLLLDELKRMGNNPDRVHRSKGTLDDITHILEAKEPYRSALRKLLRDTYVTVSSEVAGIFVKDDDDFNGRIIGEKGEIVRKGMRRTRNFSSKEIIPLFGRREKMQKLIKEEEALVVEIEGLDSSISLLDRWFQDAYQLKERLESNIREIQMRSADLSSKRGSIREKYTAIGEELILLGSELEEEGLSIDKMFEEKKGLESSIEDLDRKTHELQLTMEKAQNGIQDCDRYREETIFCLADVKAELSGLLKEEENIVDNLEREKETFSRMDGGIEEKRALIRENGQRIVSLDEESRTLEERNLEFSSVLEVKKREIEEGSAKRDALAGEITEREEKVSNQARELEDMRNKSRNLDIRAKELEYKRDLIAERMQDKYKVDISQVEMDIPADIDWGEVEMKIGELETQLEKMGEVSLGAVEEHKQLEERYEFLSHQRDDLVKGKDALMLAIKRINRTTREMFMDSFEKIRVEFNNYFRMLFNGGKAELVLEDETNVLECGIDIVVRPPGKKLHNIMQLSGGEKAMTAIALIFAIFKVNPSPFCVLDEIDAPLDESNITRFCQVLQDFLKLSQFIIVTHNRLTIQLADVLYGITMEEKGVSKIVSVKFTEETDVPEEAKAAV